MALCTRYRAEPPIIVEQQPSSQLIQRLHARVVRRKAAQLEESRLASADPDVDTHSLQQPPQHGSSTSSASSNMQTSSFLETLTITNFALVDSATILLQPGLNVISGASGASKSVLLQALGVVLGMPVDKDMIRDRDQLAGTLFTVFGASLQASACR